MKSKDVKKWVTAWQGMFEYTKYMYLGFGILISSEILTCMKMFATTQNLSIFWKKIESLKRRSVSQHDMVLNSLYEA